VCSTRPWQPRAVPGRPIGRSRRHAHKTIELTNGNRIYVASLAQAGRIDERNLYTPGPMAKFLERFSKAGLQ
jgi:hypothetical protein